MFNTTRNFTVTLANALHNGDETVYAGFILLLHAIAARAGMKPVLDTPNPHQTVAIDDIWLAFKPIFLTSLNGQLDQ